MVSIRSNYPNPALFILVRGDTRVSGSRYRNKKHRHTRLEGYKEIDMSFNFKEFIAKQASKEGLCRTTEGQLDNDGKGPDKLQECQLDKKRVKTPDSTVEKQLDNVRTANPRVASFNSKQFFAKQAAKKSKSLQTTEGQLGNDNDGPTELTDAQLDSGRKEPKPVTIQALLEKSRTGEGQKLTEAMMDDSKSKLVKHRNPETSKGNIPKLEEKRIAAKKVEDEEYEAASETDKGLMLPEVEGKDGLRTASAKGTPRTAQLSSLPTTKEGWLQYIFNSTPAHLMRMLDKMSPEIKADPRVAWAYKQKTGYAITSKGKTPELVNYNPVPEGRMTFPSLIGGSKGTPRIAQFDEPFNIGFLEHDNSNWDDGDQFERIRPDLDSLTRGRRRRTREEIEDEALIDALTRDIEEPSDAELDAIDEVYDTEDDRDDVLPEEEEGGKLDVQEDFIESSVQDISVGSAKMRQIVLSFDEGDFEDEEDVRRRATTHLISKHPSLFSFKVGRNPIEVSKNLTVIMDAGKVTATLPADAFKPKNKSPMQAA